MTYTIDLSETVKSLEGIELIENGAPVTYAVFAANALLMARTDDPVKLYDLAVQLQQQGFVEVEATEAALIQQAVLHNDQFNNLIKAPIIRKITEGLS